MERTEKPWGYEELIELNDFYVVKKLFMKNGQRCSLQYHNEKLETVTVLQGVLTLFIEDRICTLNPFETVTIAPGTHHRMMANDGDCLYLESSTIQLDDVVRIEDDYGRNV